MYMVLDDWALLIVLQSLSQFILYKCQTNQTKRDSNSSKNMKMSRMKSQRNLQKSNLQSNPPAKDSKNTKRTRRKRKRGITMIMMNKIMMINRTTLMMECALTSRSRLRKTQKKNQK